MLTRKKLGIALFLLSLLGACPLFATINYTPINKVIPNRTAFAVDFNHDGVEEFSIYSSATPGACIMSVGLNGVVELSAAQTSPYVIPNGKFGAALPSGVAVGPAQVFAEPPYLEVFAHCGRFGNWNNVANHFLGVQFSIAGQRHYGWIELSVHATATVLTTVVVGFAYETVAGKPIITGQTGVPSTCSLPSTDQTIHICAPVAGSTVASPATVSAKARWDGHSIQHMRVYVDNVDRFDVSSPVGGSLKTTLSLIPGSHHLVVTAWDASGQIIQSGETFTSK
jgi:hypothetical protein